MAHILEKAVAEPALTRRVLDLISALRQSEAGRIVYEHIRATLQQAETSLGQKEAEYIALVRLLLEAYGNALPSGSAEQLQIRLTAMDVEPRFTLEDVTALRARLEQYIRKPLPSTGTDRDLDESTFHPIVDELTAQKRRPVDEATTTEVKPYEPMSHAEPPATLAPTNGGPRVDTAYRRHLDEKRDKIQQIQSALIEQIMDVIRQNEEFGVLLDVQLEALRQTNDIEELKTLRRALINEVDKLLKGHHLLAKKLDSTYGYLQITMSDSKQLNEELTRVHLLSLTDELTDLPNRRAFLRRLEDEVARVQRYGYPLSLALIDLDGFKAINDRYGHPAGDEVLRSFAGSVLSVFRHHDMVSRYGGEEFAVILPNTDNTGALRALRKVQKRAAETSFRHENDTLALPTFSAGLALYKPGETPTNLIERADKALYRAKRLGRNRIENAQESAEDGTVA